jgi:hypothetical protein
VRTTISSAVKIAAIAAIAAIPLVGCASGGHPSSAAVRAVGTSSAPTSARDSAGSASAAGPVLGTSLPKTANQTAVRKDVLQTSCSAIPGGWRAAGTASNPTKSEVRYKITVFFTTTHATVLSYTSTKVTVQPGATAKWAASSKFPAQKEMLCPMPGIAVVK